jgi:anaerobic selenocysteine-containing dehydrogenase
VLERPKEGLDNWEICLALASRIALPSWTRAAAWRLLRGAPDTVVDLLLSRRGLSLEELASHPHGIDLGPLRPQREERVRFADRRVRLAPRVLVDELPRVEQWLDAARSGLVLIGRRHLRSNNSWMHNLRSLTKGPSRTQLLIHPLDAAERGIADESQVRVSSRSGAVEATARLTDELARGVVSLPHGFGHRAGVLPVASALEGPNMNALTDDGAVDPLLGTAVLSGVPVDVERISTEPRLK